MRDDTWRLFCLAAAVSLLVLAGRVLAEERMLFDFEDEAELKSWTSTNLDELREAARKALFERLAKEKGANAPQYRPPMPAPAPEPPVKLELAAEHATSGKHSLRLTYAGGKLPTVGTDAISVADWSGYKTFRADVTASRTCVVVFRVMRESSGRGDDWEGMVSRYEKVARLEAGQNEVVELTYAQDFAKRGKVVRFEISMYAPKEGESIFVDSIRLSTELPATTTPYSYMNVHYMGEVRAQAPFFPKLDRKIKALGTDWELTKVTKLGDKLKDKWAKPEKKTIEQVEADFRSQYEEMKKAHPRAVMTILRDGQKGYDPVHPERVYEGWRDTELQGHDPGAVYASFLGVRPGMRPSSEFFLRRRSSSVNCIRPGTFDRTTSYWTRRYSASRVTSRHNTRAMVAISGRRAQLNRREAYCAIRSPSKLALIADGAEDTITPEDPQGYKTRTNIRTLRAMAAEPRIYDLQFSTYLGVSGSDMIRATATESRWPR